MRMRFGIYIKAAGTAAVRIATVSVALSINRISCGLGIRGQVSGGRKKPTPACGRPSRGGDF